MHIDDRYWNRYTTLITKISIPYQWEILNDRLPGVPPSFCLENFRIAAGESSGKRRGMIFQDSDAAKWLEAVAYSLAIQPDPALEKTADEVIDLMGRAQGPDGYLNTYFTLVDKEGRWSNLTEGHELYCAGHLIEAATAYYEVTGKDALLNIACRFADLIDRVFGPGTDQIHGYPGHPEIELALIKLYRVTGKKKYLELAGYFVETRGQSPNWFLEEMARPGFRPLFKELQSYDPRYSQSHLPVRQQKTAEGHAVRAVYLYCAMADLAGEYDDEELLEACKTLWRNITEKRMFITGGIGSSGFWERFTIDYDLPNDSNYSETCASIGLALFGLRMSRITGDASYVDTVERTLYNIVRAGISMEGDRYFYVNPLEVWPDLCMEYTSRSHVKPVRQKWFDVACCPTNVARTFTSLGQYIYAISKDALYVNLFIQNKTIFSLGGKDVALSLKTDYPRTGDIRLGIETEAALFSLLIRLPDFGENFTVLINGTPADYELDRGYCRIRRVWDHDEVALSFDIRPRILYANPLVRSNCGKVALARGPEVYCLEEADNGNHLSALYLDPKTALEEVWREDLLGGTMLIRCKGKKLAAPDLTVSFSAEDRRRFEDVTLTAIPYGSWGNRKSGEMLVWIHELLKY
ncbi:MAG: glycoside hydrolase family 127 protein [Spirochaetaceae bacterium]|nr:glycoside hydrolase family 127 protein [Spirochaetaceae bacterium]